MDESLWHGDRYLDFLEARRELLAAAANSFLEELLHGDTTLLYGEGAAEPFATVDVPGGFSSDDEEAELRKLNEWVLEAGLPEGELLYELLDPASNQPRAILDLAWPHGLQEGLSQPVAMLVDEGPELLDAVSGASFRCFTSIDAFKAYVQREVLGTGAIEEATG